MKIGYHAPAPGAATGVADYAATLLDGLRRSAPPGVEIVRNTNVADLQIYQLGNNRLHASIYDAAIRIPGIVVVHDAVMHHFLLGALSRAAYLDEFVYNYGEWSRHIGEELWAERGACAVDPRFFRYPMLRRAVENALAVVVHNQGAAAIAREHGAGNIHVIPHFYEPRPLPDHFETERFRQRIGVTPGSTLFGIFGYLRETKRILPAIRAFRRLHMIRPETALLIAGDVVSGDLQRLLAGEAEHPGVRRLGHLSTSDFRVAGAAVNCCINLRYPAAGETSGIATQLMGMGTLLILTESRETADFPPHVCLRVPSGDQEAEVLFDQMAFVADVPMVARQVGTAGAEYVRLHNGLVRVLERYWQVIESVGTRGGELTSDAASRYVSDSNFLSVPPAAR